MFGKKFAFGVDYFSSETGENMWTNFSAETTEKDFIALRKLNIKWIRLLPLWKEFQPIKQSNSNPVYEDGKELPDTCEGKAGVNALLMDRLETVMNLAFKYGFKVDLVIFGWGFGKGNYIPSILENKNIFQHSTALLWEQKYVDYVVTRFSTHPALGGWNIGMAHSLCNKISRDKDAQNSWTRMIASTIRAVDKEHPIISGQSTYSIFCQSQENINAWQIEGHSESVDLLTVHRYPRLRHNSTGFSSAIEGSAQSSLFEDISGKICFIEKAGYAGRQSLSESAGQSYIRGDLISAYLCGCHAYFWQYAFDTTIDGISMSGLLFKDRTETALGAQAKKLMAIISHIDLPRYERNAVCVIGNNEQKPSQLAAGVSALAYQNDFGVRFCSVLNELPDSRLYIVTHMTDDSTLTPDLLEDIKNRAKRGATVYLSMSSGLLELFPQLKGVTIKERQTLKNDLTVEIDGCVLPVAAEYIYNDDATHLEVPARFSDGTPAMVCYPYGNGKIIISLFSCERSMYEKSNFAVLSKALYRAVYAFAAKKAGLKSAFYTENPFVVAKEHKIDAKRSIVSLMNYSNKPQQYTVGASVSYQVKKVLYGELDGKLQENDAVIFEIEKY